MSAFFSSFLSNLLSTLLSSPISSILFHPLTSTFTFILAIVLLVTLIRFITVISRAGGKVSFWPLSIILAPAAIANRLRIPGMRLFKHKGYYPIDIEPRTNKPSLNKKIYIAALHHFLYKVEDRLAAMDLVYLREDNLNHLGDILEPEDREEYEKLIEKYNLEDFRRDFSRETTSLLKNVSRIVNDLGLTLQGMKFEVLLHDVRNPLRSIIAAQNSQEVSGRKLYDPSTRFVVQYLRHQGEHLLALENTSKVSYLKQFLKNKKVKATTTPIFDERYGLIGILCFNIDVEAVHKFSKEEKERFFENYTRTFGETPEFEKEIAPG